MAYFFTISVIAIFAGLAFYIRKMQKKLTTLEKASEGLLSVSQQLLRLHDSVVTGQNLQIKAFEVMSKQSHALAKDFYAFREQTADGFGLVADLLNGKTQTLSEDFGSEDGSEKEKKSN
jgi:hypothetical protein